MVWKPKNLFLCRFFCAHISMKCLDRFVFMENRLCSVVIVIQFENQEILHFFSAEHQHSES